MAQELRDDEAGSDIQAPAEAVDFQALDLEQDALAEKSSVTCNIAAL